MVWCGKLICSLTVAELHEAIGYYDKFLERQSQGWVLIGLALLKAELQSREQAQCPV